MRALILAGLILIAACELQEVVTTEADDVVIAEITLRAGAPLQTALLHRTLRGTGGQTVPGAQIRITDSRGNVLMLTPAPDDEVCTVGKEGVPFSGTCYASTTTYAITPRETYTLRIDLPDGRVLTGTTQVPGAVQMIRPATPVCSLAPNDTLNVQWRSAAGVWVYAAETTLYGLAPFLAARGIELAEDPPRLFGLSISSQDTTMVFPTEFGVFQRVDPDLIEALALLQNGLPPNVTADVVIAAADRNYVNWERGGNFNPSGFVRVPSVRGDGTGVFGSIAPVSFQIRTVSGEVPCKS